MTHLERPLERGLAGPRNWMGSLIEEGRDVSGQMYRRNRYYDPQTGKFTQEDPIGLAGGLNAYGFADGDPVNYGDPYGLASQCLDPARPCNWWAYFKNDVLGLRGVAMNPGRTPATIYVQGKVGAGPVSASARVDDRGEQGSLNIDPVTIAAPGASVSVGAERARAAPGEEELVVEGSAGPLTGSVGVAAGTDSSSPRVTSVEVGIGANKPSIPVTVTVKNPAALPRSANFACGKTAPYGCD